MMKRNPEGFGEAAKEAGIMDVKTISDRDAINIKSLAILCIKKVEDLRCSLQKVGCDVWALESKMRVLERMEKEHMCK